MGILKAIFELIKVLLGLLFILGYIFVFLMFVAGAYVEARQMYHVWKGLNLIIAITGTWIIFSLFHIFALGVDAVKPSIIIVLILMVLTVAAMGYSDYLGYQDPY